MNKLNESILGILEGIDFFSGFTKEELATLLNTGEWAKTPTGKKIISQGDLDLYMYVLVQGEVEVVLEDKVLAVLHTGDTFGEFGLMGIKRTATVVTRTECMLLGFNADRLNLLPTELQIKFLKRLLVMFMIRLQKINKRTILNLPTKW
jgi:CRP-like cAMP-binding protein